MTQRYVPLFAALVAAIGVHAFVFYYASPTHLATLQPSTLEISILKQQESSQVAKKKQLQHQTPAIKPAPPSTVHKYAKLKGTSIPYAPSTLTPTKPATAKKDLTQSVAAKEKTTPHSKKASNNAQEKSAATLPNHVQQQILASITYPRYARRKGLEGKAQFELTMRNQNIDKVTLLQSSGYAILDKAAQKGIRTISALPLTNGAYQLPVVFRLN